MKRKELEDEITTTKTKLKKLRTNLEDLMFEDLKAKFDKLYSNKESMYEKADIYSYSTPDTEAKRMVEVDNAISFLVEEVLYDRIPGELRCIYDRQDGKLYSMYNTYVTHFRCNGDGGYPKPFGRLFYIMLDYICKQLDVEIEFLENVEDYFQYDIEVKFLSSPQ